MDHETLTDQLFALYDGELTGHARRAVETHLTQCRECRQRYAQWQQTARALFRVPDVQPSDVFVHQVMGRLREPVRAPRVRSWWRVRWLLPAMGLASLVLLVLSPAQRPVSLEALLLADGSENASAQIVLASTSPSADDVLGLVVEGHP